MYTKAFAQTEARDFMQLSLDWIPWFILFRRSPVAFVTSNYKNL